MNAENGGGSLAVIRLQEKIIRGDGSTTIHGDVRATDQETAEAAVQILAEETGQPVTLTDPRNPGTSKTFGMSSAFENGNCTWEPTGPKPNWEIKPQTEPPKDPRLN